MSENRSFTPLDQLWIQYAHLADGGFGRVMWESNFMQFCKDHLPSEREEKVTPRAGFQPEYNYDNTHPAPQVLESASLEAGISSPQRLPADAGCSDKKQKELIADARAAIRVLQRNGYTGMIWVKVIDALEKALSARGDNAEWNAALQAAAKEAKRLSFVIDNGRSKMSEWQRAKRTTGDLIARAIVELKQTPYVKVSDGS